MADETSTRRRFLISAIVGSGAIAGGLGISLIRASTAWAQASTGEAKQSAETLGRMARLLYPHASVTDAVYAEVVDEILSISADDPQMSALLDQAATELGEGSETEFFELDEKSQLEVMIALQERPFFQTIRFQVLAQLYSHPKVMEAINYPGSSVEHGGYVERGFDDIDWLPEEA